MLSEILTLWTSMAKFLWTSHRVRISAPIYSSMFGHAAHLWMLKKKKSQKGKYQILTQIQLFSLLYIYIYKKRTSLLTDTSTRIPLGCTRGEHNQAFESCYLYPRKQNWRPNPMNTRDTQWDCLCKTLFFSGSLCSQSTRFTNIRM